MSQRPYGYSCT